MEIKRIKELRIDNDKKQKELAKLLKIKENTYSQYENNIRNIPIEYLINLAIFYNTSIDYILRVNK